MDRGISTVLDVAICLLLIGAAVATLSGDPGPNHDRPLDADRDAKLLATSTASVSTESSVVHATLARHLAMATLLEVTVDGTAIFAETYPNAVRETIESDLDYNIGASARWEPYSNASVRSRVDIGAPPPADTTVAATRMSMPIGTDPPVGDSYDSIAKSLARALVERLFPSDRAHLALVDERTAPQMAHRYRRAGSALAVELEGPLSAADTDELNRRLVETIATRFEAELRNEFESPQSAAESTNPEITIVVRRWQR